MRKVLAGITALLLVQSSLAETIITAQDYAVDSDVVLESAVREIKSVPQDTVNLVGDAVKFVSDEVVTAANGVKAAFKSNPVDKVEKAGMIEVANAWDSSNDIVFRSYKVTDAVGKELASGAEIAPGTTVDVSGFFTGIEFPAGTSVYFRPEFNRLFVRQTIANIVAIEDVLAEQHSAVRDLMGKQVEIEAKFVEVNQSTLNELGFNWTFDNFKGGDKHLIDQVFIPAGQKIFSDGLRTAAGALGAGAADSLTFIQDGSLDWTLVVTALEQSDNADVLSAPRITTRDGNKATILVGEERTVSSGFDVKNSESSLYIQHELDSALIGVQLEVTPGLRKDGLIDLELKPKVIDLIGYDTYQATPSDALMVPLQGGSLDSVDATGANLPGIFNRVTGSPADINSFKSIPVPTLTAQLPYYRLREITTQLTVEDGSTVGMGGLIYDKLETYKDKVPVLGSIPLIGRLFRSEGEKSVKRNLMIFVTATQVGIDGRKASDLALNK
jgi:general secretion pathway protein D